MTGLPPGTVTFLFADVEASTRLLRQLGQDQYRQALADYQRLLRAACGASGGHEIDTQGDSIFFAFGRAREAVAAAAEAQRALARHRWPEGEAVRARMGLHTGEASFSDGRYVGLSVHRAARVCGVAAGGQVLLSQGTTSMLEDEDLGELGLRELGRYELKDFERPVRLHQLQVPGLPGKFPGAKKKGARPPRTVPLLVAGVTALLVAVAVALAIITRDDGTGGTRLGPGSVGVIDPKTNHVVDAIPLGFTTSLIAAGLGHVWVVDPKGSTLTKIDPRTRRIVGRFAIESGAIPTGIAVGKGSVWVGAIRGRSLALFELGPELGEQRGTIVLARSRGRPFSVNRESVLPAVGKDGIVTLEPGRGEVSRIADGSVSLLTEGLDAGSITATDDAIWLGGKTRVAKIDPDTGATLASIPVSGLLDSTSTSIQSTKEATWFAGTAQPRLFRIDPTGAPVTTFSVCEGPSGITVGPDAVWVACADGTVSRVNGDGTVDVISLATRSAGIVAAFGQVWTSPAA